MTELSGLVAILDEHGRFVEARDLGPNPVATKPGRVLPLTEDRPPLGDGQGYGEATVEIIDGKATRHWPVIDIPPPRDLAAELDAATTKIEALQALLVDKQVATQAEVDAAVAVVEAKP